MFIRQLELRDIMVKAVCYAQTPNEETLKALSKEVSDNSESLTKNHPIPQEYLDIASEYNLHVRRGLTCGTIRHEDHDVHRHDMPGCNKVYIPRIIFLSPWDNESVERASFFHELGHAINCIRNDYQAIGCSTLTSEAAAWETGFAVARKYGYDFKEDTIEYQTFVYCMDAYIIQHLKKYHETFGAGRKDSSYTVNMQDVVKGEDTKKGTPRTISEPYKKYIKKLSESGIINVSLDI